MANDQQIKYVRRCLKCGRETSADNYTCTCGEEKWTREYRMVGIRYELENGQKESAAHAFHNYDLRHPDGIFQYFFIPHAGKIPNLPFRVGSTPLLRLPHLGHSLNVKLFLKNEGANPSGSFKDRETAMAAIHSLAEKKQKAVIYSSGNAAASAALFARHLNIDLITCVAGDTYPEKIRYIRQNGSAVIRIGDRHTNYEKGYRLFAQLNEEGYFAKNGFDNWSVRNPYRTLGDRTTAWEIILQYREQSGQAESVPDYVVVPTGNGSCLAGMWRGFCELYRLQVINKRPKMVSAAIRNASPIVKALRKNLRNRPAVCELDNLPEEELEIGSTILAEEGYDSVEATKAVLDSGGLAMGVNRREIRQSLVQLMQLESDCLQEHQLLPEPASLTTLAVIRRMKREGSLPEGASVVALISGHGRKSVGMLRKLLRWKPRLRKSLDALLSKDINGMNQHIKPGHIVEVDSNLQELKQAFITLSN